MPCRPILPCLLLALASSPALHAQEELDRWRATGDLGLSASTGNTSLAVLNAGLRIKHLQTDVMELEWGVTYRYGESEGEVVQRNAATTLNVDLQPNARWSPFAFASAERDPFRRLELRSNAGSGVKYTFAQEAGHELSLSVAGLYSHESFTVDQPTREDARWSARLKLERALGNAVTVENTTFFKPVWDQFSDYDVEVRTKLSSRITQRLAITITHEYLHDSTPPAGVAREDQRFQAGATVDLF